MGVSVTLVRIGQKYTDRVPYSDGTPGYRYTVVDSEFGWDVGKYTGDRKIGTLLDGDRYWVDETQDIGRPKDSDVLRSEMIGLVPDNADRWNLLADTLRDNPDIYVMVSY